MAATTVQHGHQKIASPKRELILRNGPVESVWLKVGPGADENPDGARIDFSFVVWIPQVWHQLNNDPRNFFMAERPNFRRPVDPLRIVAYFGGGGKLAWEEITVPEGVTVIDQHGKPGDGPTFTGAVYDMNTGQTIAFTLTGTGTVKGTLKVVEGRQANVSIGEAGRFNEVGTWGGGMNCQPDGSFEFKNVPPGDYLIGPSRGSDPKAGDPNVKTITVKAGETVTVEIVEEE